ncbi:MAG TPA: TonB-dependent receptor plug domain-containing protein, partial [Usitatibacter sp.]|nr:TonB-dependent receptor plug domain-containing protein [Usitatibacter sp.]
MKTLPLAGLLGLATLGAQAQALPSSSVANLESFVVTATRSLAATETLREAIVISREEIEAAGALSLGELLQRRAGIELRATGGPGQPQGLFIRGAGSAHTLVLIDGLRAGSATVGTTSIENIPLELIERIEVVKGPLSSLYGSDAIGGVVQIFTRGKNVPHLFATTAYGSDDDRRLVAGLSTVDAGTSLAISAGARKVNAPSAANSRAICHQLAR